MIDKLNDSIKEYEDKQQAIRDALMAAEELVNKNFTEKLAANEKSRFPSPQEVIERSKYGASFQLPEREGYQTLGISFFAADPYNHESPDIILKVLQYEQPRIGADEDMQRAFTIRRTPDGDYVLETNMRDLTQFNKMHKGFNKAMSMGLSDAETASVGLAYAQATFGLFNAEMAASAEEKQLGLHASQVDDINDLKGLLAEAQPFPSQSY